LIGFKRTQYITPIGLFYKNMGRLWRGVCLCEELVGVTWRESDCEDLVGVNWSLSDCEELVGVTHRRLLRREIIESR